MIDQLKDIKTILQSHIQTEIALGTANDFDITNFDYLIAIIDQSLLESDDVRKQKIFDDELKIIDKKFYGDLIKSLSEMQRIPPVDKKKIDNLIAYCDSLREAVDTKEDKVEENLSEPEKPSQEPVLEETAPEEKKEPAIDAASLVNEKISKRVLEYYYNELNELKKLIATNLIIISRLDREGKETNKAKKRIDRITEMKKYYETAVERIKTSPVSEILYLDVWDSNNPDKVTKFTKKALNQNKNINLIQKELKKLKYDEMLQLELSSYKKRSSFFQKAKLNHVQNRIVKLRKKQGKIIIKQRYLVLEKAKSAMAKYVKEREKLHKITKSHLAHTNKMYAIKLEKQRKQEEKKLTRQTIDQLMKSLLEDIKVNSTQEMELAKNRIGYLSRKDGTITNQKNLDQKPDIYQSTSTVIEPSDNQLPFDQLEVPELSADEIAEIDSYKEELAEEFDPSFETPAQPIINSEVKATDSTKARLKLSDIRESMKLETQNNESVDLNKAKLEAIEPAQPLQPVEETDQSKAKLNVDIASPSEEIMEKAKLSEVSASMDLNVQSIESVDLNKAKLEPIEPTQPSEVVEETDQSKAKLSDAVPSEKLQPVEEIAGSIKAQPKKVRFVDGEEVEIPLDETIKPDLALNEEIIEIVNGQPKRVKFVDGEEVKILLDKSIKPDLPLKEMPQPAPIIPQFIDREQPDDLEEVNPNLSFRDRLSKIKYAIIKGWQAFKNEAKNNDDQLSM